jgi:hypothetical protein
LLHCYDVAEEEDPVEENPHNIQILEVEGESEVEGPQLVSEYYSPPMNINKVNIGTTKNQKIASTGGY